MKGFEAMANKKRELFRFFPIAVTLLFIGSSSLCADLVLSDREQETEDISSSQLGDIKAKADEMLSSLHSMFSSKDRSASEISSFQEDWVAQMTRDPRLKEELNSRAEEMLMRIIEQYGKSEFDNPRKESENNVQSIKNEKKIIPCDPPTRKRGAFRLWPIRNRELYRNATTMDSSPISGR